MKFFQKLINRLNGLYYPQEYLCFSGLLQQPLHTYLMQGGRPVLDVTNLHCFVGYSPVILAFRAAVLAHPNKNITLILTQFSLPINEDFDTKDALALLSLQKIREQQLDDETLVYYEGVRGWHRFLPKFNQLAIDLNNRLYGKRPGNVFLAGNRYRQVQIGYASPRKINLVTVGDEEREAFNLFPTDLHGQITPEHYLISLRYEGKACAQVMAAKKLVLSDMEQASHKQVYRLGKNHMQPLKELSSFDFMQDFSKTFLLPLPCGMTAYKELQLEQFFDHGIHRLLLFRILHETPEKQETQSLAHIHNVCATWRRKKGLESNYLLR